MPAARPKPTTLAADKAYDAGEFVHETAFDERDASFGAYPPPLLPRALCEDPARLSSREMQVESAVEAHGQRVHALP
jgi:hypothetical protein